MDSNSPRGTPIRGQRYLPPLIEEEQPYEESVASSEEEEVSYDMDSFESSEEEEANYDMDSFESFDEEDEDEEGDNYVEIVLYDDPRITARIPRPDSIKAEPLSNWHRTELLIGKTPSSFSGMQYISDIYLIKSGFNFIVPCRVSIQLKTKYNENMNDLKAVVRDNDQWTEIPATLENGYAVFKVKSMDCVYVVTIPKTTEAYVTEDGYEFASDEDNRIGISVPKKAVERPTKFESFDEEDEDEEGDNYVEIVLYDDPRITARIPRPDSIKAEPLSNWHRTELLIGKTPSSFSGMQYISDIYLIKSGFNFIVPCRVSIQLKTKYNENMNDLKAVVRDNDQWTEIPATLENGYAVFKVKSMDYVYVVTFPKTTEAYVTEDGYEFASDEDNRIGISVPKKAVERPTTLLIKVLLPNGVAAGKIQQIRNKCNIVAISPCLCVEYRDSGKLKKPVTMTLPLNLPSKTQDCKVVILTLEEDDVTLVKTTIRVGDRGTVSAKIHSPKNQVCAVVKKTVDVKLLHDEALLKLGIAQKYQVLSFWDSKDRRVLLIQCTPLEKLQEVIDKRNEEGYVLERSGKSKTLILRQDQRLRIDINGSIKKYFHHPQIANFITVLFSAHDQTTFFPYKIRRTVGGTYFGILNISSDNFKKRELCSMHFDPDMLIGSQNIGR